ncbi:MAG: phage portal protein [Phycisphaerales bacterium]|nr:phage portal protein [Phycisphaerales bacterium]
MWPFRSKSASGPSTFAGVAGRLVRRLVGSYDAAATNDSNRRHWTFADGASPDAAMSAGIRRTLRNRARYECMNNSYARGIVLTLADDCIGTGPRLQMLSDNKEANEAIEREFERWAQAIGLAERLHVMRTSRAESGECFAILTQNPSLGTPVQLDIRLVEADQVSTPDLSAFDRSRVDGIVFDEYGNPIEYHVLKHHPGDPLAGTEYDPVGAEHMIHYFRADRPGQSRGVPEITPAIPLFAMLRRYTLAVVGAAETAANLAGVIYTESPAGDAADEVEAMDAVEIEPRALLTMPAGWRMEQMRAEQPTTTYGDFKRELLNEIARCLKMPFNVAAGNSSTYNYASGRLDFQMYDKTIRVDRKQIERVILDRLLMAFLDEAVLVSNLLPIPVRTLIASAKGQLPKHQWFWDSREHVDPSKEATAQGERLKNHTTTLSAEYARVGLDWEDQIRQRAKEKALMAELGLTVEPSPAPPGASAPANRTEDDDAEDA